jgi:hypothetical protein
MDRVVCGATQPDLTLVLDLDPRVALKRASHRDARQNAKPGRFEAEGLSFEHRVRAGYRALARREPARVRLIASDRPHEEVEGDIRQVVEERLREGESGRQFPVNSARPERIVAAAEIVRGKKGKVKVKGKSQKAKGKRQKSEAKRQETSG